MTDSSRKLAMLCAAVYLLLVAALIAVILVKTGGHFVYALDDPYIHLALAENLAHGHYGINPTEFSSPSSSILWPFLLIPFAGTPVHVFVPLALNIIFGVVAAGLIGYAAGQWRFGSSGESELSWQQVVVAILLLLVANLASLSIVGMEHVLQVMLAICCAIGVIEALRGRQVPAWCLAAAVVAPMVRYEDLSLTLAVSFALFGLKRWKTGIAVFGMSLIPLIAFSGYLKSKGLPALPMSVLVKGSAFAKESLPAKLLHLFEDSLKQDFVHPVRFPILLLFLAFVVLTFNASTMLRRYVFAGAATLGLLQLTLGQFGWFHRYEVYALIFLLMVCLSVVAEYRSIRFAYVALALLLCASFYVISTVRTPEASNQIYLQQYQMRRFVADFYKESYAVNDVGLVSFQRAPGAYVLDVFGLASVEAGSQQNKTAEWLASIVERHGVDLAILYPDWFHIPPSWKPVGQMCEADGRHLGGSCVVFYSTSPRKEAVIRSELTAFSGTLPKGSVYTAF
jgi:hypothetical protein